MAYTYKDENGQEIIIHDLKESKELREKYHFSNNEGNTYTNETHKKHDFSADNNEEKTGKKTFKIRINTSCFGCLTSIVSWILAFALIHQGIKELGKDHVNEYCNIDKYIENHQEKHMEEELEKKTYYIYQKQESDVMSQEDYEKIKNSLPTDCVTQTVEIDGTKKVKVTSNVRILSRKKKLEGFEKTGEYTFTKDDQIFVFTKTYNKEGKAQDIKIVGLEYFDTYIKEGYNFIGIASFDAYNDTEFKTQYASVLESEEYNYSDANEKTPTYSKNKK